MRQLALGGARTLARWRKALEEVEEEEAEALRKRLPGCPVSVNYHMSDCVWQ